MKDFFDTPLIRQPYIYTGRDDEHFTNGETYYVIESGYHWIKEWGFGLWITNDDDKTTTDIDYGVFLSKEDFRKSFWQS